MLAEGLCFPNRCFSLRLLVGGFGWLPVAIYLYSLDAMDEVRPDILGWRNAMDVRRLAQLGFQHDSHLEFGITPAKAETCAAPKASDAGALFVEKRSAMTAWGSIHFHTSRFAALNQTTILWPLRMRDPDNSKNQTKQPFCDLGSGPIKGIRNGI